MSSWKQKEAAIRALERNGRVNPVDLIEAAKSPDHPCHNDFTWDIQTAAEERWRDQARSIIRQCKFEVVYEDITTPVVSYVSCGDDTGLFLSLPKIRSSLKVSLVLATEVKMLHGMASRVYGIALSKQSIVGADVVAQLESIQTQLATMKATMEE